MIFVSLGESGRKRTVEVLPAVYRVTDHGRVLRQKVLLASITSHGLELSLSKTAHVDYCRYERRGNRNLGPAACRQRFGPQHIVQGPDPGFPCRGGRNPSDRHVVGMARNAVRTERDHHIRFQFSEEPDHFRLGGIPAILRDSPVGALHEKRIPHTEDAAGFLHLPLSDQGEFPGGKIFLFVLSPPPGLAARRAKHRHPPTGLRILRQGPSGKERLIVGMSEDRKNPAGTRWARFRFSLFADLRDPSRT